MLIPKEHQAKLGPRSSECRLLGYYEPKQYKLHENHSGKTVFSRDVKFDKRTPVAPLIEGETGNDLPDNTSPSPVFQSVPKSATGLPTPSTSPLPSSNEREETPSGHEEETPPVVNPSQQGTDLTPDLGYTILWSQKTIAASPEITRQGVHSRRIEYRTSRTSRPSDLPRGRVRPKPAGMVGSHPERIYVASRTQNKGKGSARGRPSRKSYDWLQMGLQGQSQQNAQSTIGHQRLPAET